MTKREKEIIDILRVEPMISQNDLAKRLGISRSSAAVHITNMMKKGIIAGKGYVIREENFIAVIGGSNVDITGFTDGAFKPRDSNPGQVMVTVGGVARNIAENIARMGDNVRLLTLVGDDQNGKMILSETKAAGVDTGYILEEKDKSTGVYVSIHDETGDIKGAVSQMTIFDDMDESYPESVFKILDTAELIALDTNLSEKALKYITSKLHKTKIFADTVSATKAVRITDVLDRIFVLMLKKDEAVSLTGIEYNGIESIRQMGKWIHSKGCSNVFITMDEGGVYALNSSYEGIVSSQYNENYKDVNGTGEAFLATVMKESQITDDIRRWAESGLASSMVTFYGGKTINRELRYEQLEVKRKWFAIRWKSL